MGLQPALLSQSQASVHPSCSLNRVPGPEEGVQGGSLTTLAEEGAGGAPELLFLSSLGVCRQAVLSLCQASVLPL